MGKKANLAANPQGQSLTFDKRRSRLAARFWSQAKAMRTKCFSEQSPVAPTARSTHPALTN